MKKGFLYLVSMRWSENEEPICAGRSLKRTKRGALKILRDREGKGNVDRGSAMCSVPIMKDDLVVEEIPIIY